MAWRDRLQPGKFRDASFLIDADDTTLGRRTVLHEYPLRSVPYAEDLGRRAREHAIECYVIGAEYMEARDALMRALDAEGSGTLVHPYLGVLKVAVKDARKRESTAEGGMARFTITFVEAGENIQPLAAPATGDVVGRNVEGSRTAVKTVFDKVYTVDKKPQFVTEAAKALLDGVLKSIGDAVKSFPTLPGPAADFAKELDGAADVLETTMRAPGDLSSMLLGRYAALRLLHGSPIDRLRALRQLFDHGSAAAPVMATTPARATTKVNQDAILALTQRSAVIEAVQASSEIEYATVEDVQGVRDELTGELDAHMAVADDESYSALFDLRTAMVADLDARGHSAAHLVAYTPVGTEPALVVAHRLYGDATRATEIVTRNRLRHPGFVPGGEPLQVLSRA